MTLSAEQRRKVAEECLPNLKWFVMEGGVIAETGWKSFQAFQPEHYPLQKDALVQKVAQLIEERKKKYIAASLAPNPNFGKMHANVWRTYLERLGEALATNDVNAIEALLLELLGDNDG